MFQFTECACGESLRTLDQRLRGLCDPCYIEATEQAAQVAEAYRQRTNGQWTVSDLMRASDALADPTQRGER